MAGSLQGHTNLVFRIYFFRTWLSHWSLWPYLQDTEPAYQLCNFVWQAVNAVRKSILSAQWAERTPVDTCKSQLSMVSYRSRVSLCSSTVSTKGQPGPFLDFWVLLGVWHSTRLHHFSPGPGSMSLLLLSSPLTLLYHSWIYSSYWSVLEAHSYHLKMHRTPLQDFSQDIYWMDLW